LRCKVRPPSELFSSLLAVLAKNYSPQVQATYAIALGDFSWLGFTALPCLDKATTLIPSDRLFVADGQHDELFGGWGGQAQLQNVTGIQCPAGSTECWHPDNSGAGWYRVQDSQVTDGKADHCYWNNEGCFSNTNDPNWYPSNTYNWALKPSLDWLATFGQSRAFSK
jgi:hypothetical protein